MIKYIIFSLLSLAVFITLPTARAADQQSAEFTPAQTMPANPEEVASPVEAPASSMETQRPAANLRPNNDNLVDYRYCLELKTNQEIAECRYKKK